MLTESEAAALLKIDRRTLRRLIDAGRLAAIDVGSGGRRRYRIASVAIENITSRTQSVVVIDHPFSLPRRLRSRPSAASLESFLPSI